MNVSNQTITQTEASVSQPKKEKETDMFKGKGSTKLNGAKVQSLLSENSVVELFSGVGGTRLGAEQVGFHVNFSAEIDKACIQTYFDNFGHDSENDITILSAKQIPDCTVFAASTPCQSNSIQGNRQGIGDDRGELAIKVLELIKAKRPPAIFIENVKGLLSVNGGNDFKLIIQELKSFGYWVHYKVLKASDYGVPQKRERLFIVGFLENVPFKFPEQFKKVPQSKTVLERLVHENFFLTQAEIQTQLEATQRYEITGCNHKFKILNENSSANTLLRSPSSLLKNLVKVKYSKNAPSTRGVIELPDPKSGVTKKYHLRRLTPRECARLQGFPDSYKLTSSSAQSYKQMGNSVAVPVIREIFREILVSLSLWKAGKTSASNGTGRIINPKPPKKVQKQKQVVAEVVPPKKKSNLRALSLVRQATTPPVYPHVEVTADSNIKNSISKWLSKDPKNHFMTPVWFTEFLKFVTPIELDAASSPEANSVHKFPRILTKDDDALAQSWKVQNGQSVFVNPPYCGTADLLEWAKKISSEYRKNKQPIFVLVPARSPETKWFRHFLENATHVVFCKKRLVHNDLISNQAGKFASALVVFGGDQLGERIEILSELGELVETSCYRKQRIEIKTNGGKVA